MKRSEILGIIELTLEDYLGEKIRHPDVLADLILKDIEKAGMLPPTSYFIATKELLEEEKFNDVEWLIEEGELMDLNKWEPEDE